MKQPEVEDTHSEVVAHFLVRTEFRPDSQPQFSGCIELIATGEKAEFSSPGELAQLIVAWTMKPLQRA
ncbi:MAG: hypothetical protein WEE89_06045 [Gemmatimonadota bacterium]